MTVHVNIGGTWKNVDSVYCNIGGVWKTVNAVYSNIGGVWKTGYSVDVIGVQDTGARSSNGATLKQVRYNGSGIVETTLAAAYFDAHPAYQFPDWTDAAGNVFCTIPIAYWWRGNLPDVADGTTPRWTMLLSTLPGTVNINGTSCTFAASPGAFKLSGAWLDNFYYGKYRGYNAGSNKVGSKSGQTAWGNVSFANFRTYCSNNGTGYHMGSLFEWHEILARMVIEKKTFQLFPEAIRQTQSSCKWRGIEDMAYHGSIYDEWMDGIRTDASGKYEAWDQANGTYSATGQAAAIGTNEYSQGVVGGGIFDGLFIASTIGSVATSFIPDYCGRQSDRVGRVCDENFGSGGPQAHLGAFSSNFYHTSSGVSATVGSRLAKW